VLLHFIAFTLLTAVHISLSRAQPGSIIGHVIDAATGRPIAQAIVILLEARQQCSSDEDGRFQYNQITPGQYTISVRHISYANVERTFVGVRGFCDSLNIAMQPAILQSDEVIVRSTRTLSTMNATPYPLSVDLKEQFLRHAPVTISEALNTVPGIAVVRDGSWETTISIRGMSRSNIVTMVDNTRIETSQDIAGVLSLVNMHDLERVETLKSSGSVLYGTGALGGALHLMTKRSSFTNQFQYSTELTNDITSVDGGSSHFLALEGSSDRYVVRVSGGFRNAGNTSTPEGVLRNSQYQDFSLSGFFGIKTIRNHSLSLTYQRCQAEDAGIPGSSAFGTTAAVRYTLARRELLGLEYSIPNLTPTIPFLTLRISQQEIDRNVESRQGDTLTITPHAVHTTRSIQIESRIYPMINHLLVVGAEAWGRELDSRRERFFPIKNTLIGERPVPFSRYFSSGLYAQDELTIVPNTLTITTGARYDWISITNDETFNPEYVITNGTLQFAPANQQMLWQSGSANDASWSANAGIWYALNPHLDATLLAATAFRSPSLEERFQFIDLGSVVRLGDPHLKPERSMCLNAGFRVHTEGLNVQTDLFVNQLTNLVTEVPDIYEGRAALLKKNIGEARLYGFEISSEYPFSSRMVLRASIAYVRGEDTHNQTPLPQIAPLNGRMELNSFVQQFGTWSFACTYAATQNELATGELRTPGYAVYDLSIASVPWNLGPMVFTFRSGIQNLFDRSFRNHLSSLRGIVKSEPGRNFFISATISV
jgi:hemoglobin/transferrin/lactoferrin receptor protein